MIFRGHVRISGECTMEFVVHIARFLLFLEGLVSNVLVRVGLVGCLFVCLPLGLLLQLWKPERNLKITPFGKEQHCSKAFWRFHVIFRRHSYPSYLCCVYLWCFDFLLFFGHGGFGVLGDGDVICFCCVRIRSLGAILPTCHWNFAQLLPASRLRDVTVLYWYMATWSCLMGWMSKVLLFCWTSPFEIHNRTVINQSFDTRLISFLAGREVFWSLNPPGARSPKNVIYYLYD